MKINYNELMKQEISNLKSTPKLLLHVCCAPCTSSVLERLNTFNVVLYYYNPNTYPKEEYFLRAKQFDKLSNSPLIIEEYRHTEFLEKVKGFENQLEGGLRCEKCIKLRLEKSFKYAKENNFDYITTTLSVSPHKNAEYINKIGLELSKKYNVKFLVADFKKENGFLNSIKLSKEFGLYRQDYCGCEFSITKKED